MSKKPLNASHVVVATLRQGCGEICATVRHGKGLHTPGFICLAQGMKSSSYHAAATGHLLSPETKVQVCSRQCEFACMQQ